MTQMNTIDLAKWTVEQAQKAGANQASVSLTKNTYVQVEYRKGEIEKLKETTSHSLNLDVYVDNRFMRNTTSDLKKDSLKPLIEEAVASAKYLPEDKHRVLPDSKYYPKGRVDGLKINDPAYSGIETSQRKRIAAETEKIADSRSDKVISATCGYFDSSSTVIVANSEGFIGFYPCTDFGLYAEITVDGAGRGRPRGWDSVQTRYMDDLPTPESVAKRAVKRGLARIGQEKIESCRCDMIVENRVVGERLLGMLQRPATARSLQQKQSFLNGKVGQKVASEKLTIIDDALLEKGQGTRPFDGEGLASRRLAMIENGVLRNYYVDNYYGRKLGMELTTEEASNIIIVPGEKSLEQLIAGCDRAILVTDFIGGNSNSTTGDFSLGIIGELIENGQRVRPVCEMNIAGNALELWSHVGEIGSDTFKYSQNRTPSLLFKDVAFSGI
jgi:PmbA protein